MITWNQPNLSDPRLMKADAFMVAAHAAVGQYRKYTKDENGNPHRYHVHPRECLAILQALPQSSNITIAQQIGMLLHDTIEDTRKFEDENGNVIKKPGEFVKSGRKLILVDGITLDVIEDIFTGDDADPNFTKEIRRITSGLTDTSMPWDGNREKRKKIDLDHTAEQAADVKTCKLADVISNTPSILTSDPGFARKWMWEKADMLPILKDGDPILFAIVEEQVKSFFAR